MVSAVSGQDFLLGDATKAKQELDWKPKYDFQVCTLFSVTAL